MRDMMLFGAMVVFFALAVSNTFIAYMLWGWAGLAAINYYVFGFMQTLPIVQAFAIVTLILILIGKDDERQPFSLNRTSGIYLVYTAQALVCATLAYPDLARNWELAINLIKTLLYCVLMPMVLTSRYRIHAFVVMLAIATGLHGLLDGLKFIANAGRHVAMGIGKFGDNNHFALVLVMSLPLLIYISRFVSSRLIKLGFMGATVLTVLAVVATHSRGGLACMVAVALWFIATSKRKMAGLLLVSVSAVLVVAMAPADWTERMNTIRDAGADNSFMQRVSAWKVSSAIALENPVFGGGFHAVQARPVWERFENAPSLLPTMQGMDFNIARAAHSIYFEVMGDGGFLGLIIFLTVFLNAILTARTVIREAIALGPEFEWARNLAEMLLLTIIAYLAGGALLSAAYFEMPYIVCMLLEVLKLQVRRERRLTDSNGARKAVA
jgi:probable O-glycosylation ligase (exosortase A-associated)